MKLTDKFLIGCNYWASNAGVYTWRNFDKDVIVKDMHFLKEYGVNCIRVFPTWEDFQPLERNPIPQTPFYDTYPFKMRINDKPLLEQKFESGLSEIELEKFKFLLDVAKENDIQVIVAFITGWMSGRMFFPPAFKEKDVLRDPEAILWQCKFIKDLIGEIKHYDNIIAWEPGNECNCLHFGNSEYECELWLMTIVNAIRLADNTRPVFSGMHGVQLQGSWNIPMQGRYTDALTTHPYPGFTDYCEREDLSNMRASLHAACETSYYRSISGKPAFVEEINTLGPAFLSDDFMPDYFERSLMTSLAVGSFGYLWWCGFEQNKLNFPPYDVATLERNLGLAYADHSPKPVLEKMKETSKTLKEIGVLPVPKADAIAVLMHYNDSWKSAYGSFMLGVQSGEFIDFAYEEGDIKDSEYYILPCIRLNGALSIYALNKLKEKVENGAKLLITYNGGSIAEFEELTGLKVCGRNGVNTEKKFTINGKDCTVVTPVNLKLVASSANVLIKDEKGDVLLTENTYGKGSVMFFNAPLEDFYTESYLPENTALYEVYKTFFKEKNTEFSIESDKCMVTRHELSNGKMGVMINNYDERNELAYEIEKGYKIENILYAKVKDGKLEMQRKYAYLELVKA